MSEVDALRVALNTPPESDERARLAEKWADHFGHDGTIHAEIHSGCRFGSALRDDCCQPRRVSRYEDEPTCSHCGGVGHTIGAHF